VLPHVGVINTYYTLEREYQGNMPFCSSIPAGFDYEAHIDIEEDELYINGVWDRYGIKFHSGGENGAYCDSIGGLLMTEFTSDVHIDEQGTMLMRNTKESLESLLSDLRALGVSSRDTFSIRIADALDEFTSPESIKSSDSLQQFLDETREKIFQMNGIKSTHFFSGVKLNGRPALTLLERNQKNRMGEGNLRPIERSHSQTIFAHSLHVPTFGNVEVNLGMGHNSYNHIDQDVEYRGTVYVYADITVWAIKGVLGAGVRVRGDLVQTSFRAGAKADLWKSDSACIYHDMELKHGKVTAHAYIHRIWVDTGCSISCHCWHGCCRAHCWWNQHKSKTKVLARTLARSKKMSTYSSLCEGFRRLQDNETAIGSPYLLPVPSGINATIFPDSYVDDDNMPEYADNYMDLDMIKDQLNNGHELNVSMSVVREMIEDGLVEMIVF